MPDRDQAPCDGGEARDDERRAAEAVLSLIHIFGGGVKLRDIEMSATFLLDRYIARLLTRH